MTPAWFTPPGIDADAQERAAQAAAARGEDAYYHAHRLGDLCGPGCWGTAAAPPARPVVVDTAAAFSGG